jgi:hypothetical protein
MRKLGEVLRKGCQRLSRTFGIQVVPITIRQKELLKIYPELRYRHFIAQEAILMQSGQMNLRESRFLGQLVANLETEGPIVEIGTLFGWSTRIICLFREDGRELISVDNYSWNPFDIPPDIHFEITKQILSDPISRGDLQLIKMSSAEFYRIYSGPPPALFVIDADHSYEAVKADIQGGIALDSHVICGHDYDPRSFPGVVRAVDEFGCPKVLVDTLWVL